jgi:hypothetical protein
MATLKLAAKYSEWYSNLAGFPLLPTFVCPMNGIQVGQTCFFEQPHKPLGSQVESAPLVTWTRQSFCLLGLSSMDDFCPTLAFPSFSVPTME